MSGAGGIKLNKWSF